MLMKLSVVTVAGQEPVSISLPPTESVRALRKHIKEVLGVPRPRQWLVHGSSVLPSTGSLADCGLEDGSQVTLVVRRPGSRIITASDDSTAKVWDADSRECLLTLQGHSKDLWMAVFSPDGELALTASEDRSARLWDAETGEVLRVFQGHRGAVNSAVFSRDGGMVLTSSDDGRAILWSTADGEVVRTMEVGRDDILYADPSPDSSSVVLAVRHRAELWSAESGEMVRRFEGHTDSVNTAAFSSDGRLVSTASRDHFARIWRVDTAECLQVLDCHARGVISGGGVLSALFLPGDEEVFVVSGHAATVFSVTSGAPMRSFGKPGLTLQCGALSPSGELALTSDIRGGVQLWAGETREVVDCLEGHRDSLRWAAFSP